MMRRQTTGLSVSSKFFRALAFLWALQMLLAPCHAQGVSAGITQAPYGDFGCEVQENASVSNCTSRGNNDLLDYQGSIYAVGDSHGLHAATSVSLAISDEGGETSYGAYGEAYAYNHDYLSFSGTIPTGSVIDITLTTDGTTSGAATAYSELQGYGNGLDSTPSLCTFMSSGSCTITEPISSGYGFELYTELIASASVQLNAGQAGSSFANYVDTAYISGFNAFDAAGNPISLTYSSSEGYTYPMGTVSAVPEASDYAMFALGLGFLGFIIRKRKGSLIASGAQRSVLH